MTIFIMAMTEDQVREMGKRLVKESIPFLRDNVADYFAKTEFLSYEEASKLGIPLKPFRSIIKSEVYRDRKRIDIKPAKIVIYDVDKMVSEFEKFFESHFKSLPPEEFEKLAVEYMLTHELGHVLWNFKKIKMIEEAAKSAPNFEEAVLKLASSYSEYEEEFYGEQVGHFLTLLREKSKEKLGEAI